MTPYRLSFSVLLAILCCTASRSEADDSKPNIIYLMLDEWGYFESGHMGNQDLITPNIDQFAAEGMRFTNAYAGAPVCGPTRCAVRSPASVPISSGDFRSAPRRALVAA